jgi:CheY-like chemotaxis protein
LELNVDKDAYSLENRSSYTVMPAIQYMKHGGTLEGLKQQNSLILEMDRLQRGDKAEVREFTMRLAEGFTQQRTELGKILAPLVEELRQNPPYTESPETFRILWEFFKRPQVRKALADAPIGAEDIAFLSIDPVGSLIRRPVLNHILGLRLEKEMVANTPGEQTIKEAMVAHLISSSWSRFEQENRGKLLGLGLGPDVERALTRTNDQLEKIISPDLSYGAGIVQRTAEISQEIFHSLHRPLEFLYRKAGDCMGAQDNVFFTDPDHAIAVHVDAVISVLSFASKTNRPLPPFDKETKMMVVEDNPDHQKWTRLLGLAKNSSWFCPNPNDPNENPELRPEEAKGAYRTAERSLSVISAKYDATGELPDVVFTDIELDRPGGKPGMNGLEFVKRLTDFAQSKGKRIHVVMVYSSNMTKYQGEVEKLGSLVDHSFNKSQISASKLVEIIGVINDKMAHP